jgi:hypothetical protein
MSKRLMPNTPNSSSAPQIVVRRYADCCQSDGRVTVRELHRPAANHEISHAHQM